MSNLASQQKGAHSQPRWGSWSAAGLIALTILSLGLRLSALTVPYTHPDEPIATGVVSGMLKSHSLDTNWELYEIGKFKYPMYNFSSYYLTLAVVCEPYRWITGQVPDLPAMRFISMLAGTGVVVLIYMIGNRLAGPLVALLGASLTAVSPQLFQDSLYARPEALFTLLFLIAIALSLRSRSALGLLVASALIGFLLACKISALLVAPMPLLIYLLRQEQRDLSSLFLSCTVFATGVAFGAFLGAPYAFIHPDVYWSGVQVLQQQYTSGGGPHGLRNAGILARIWYLLLFLAPTIGVVTLVASIWGLLLCVWRRDWVLIALGGPAILTIAYMGTLGLFAERNFSHALPIGFLFAAIGIVRLADQLMAPLVRTTAIAALMIASLWPGASVLWTMRFDVLSGREAKRVEAMRNAVHSRFPDIAYIIWPNLVYGEAYPSLVAYVSKFKFPFIIEFFHYDDRFGEEVLNRFLSQYDYSKVATVDGPFKQIAPSTIQAYLAFSHLVYEIDGPRGTVPNPKNTKTP